MRRRRSILRCVVVCAGISLLFCLPEKAIALQIAYDNADPANPNNASYGDGWDNGDNGGFGFLPWGGIYGGPADIDTAPDPENNIGAPAAFRLGTGGFGYGAFRGFANPLQANQSFKIDFDPFAYGPIPDPAEFGYVSNDTLLEFSGSTAGNPGKRFGFYRWNAKYNNAGSVETYGSDEWAVTAVTAFDNLNGGAALSLGGAGFMTGYTGTDSTDGFTVQLDTPTIDTYRLRIFDDNVTKVDVSGQFGGVAGDAITSVYIWAGDATPATIDTSFFTNLEILDTPTAGVAGDYNNNGKVDAGDYVVWRKAGTLSNEVDAPGTINAADYTAWRARYGNPSGSGSSLKGAGVPEPTSWMLVTIGSAILAARRKSR